MDNSQGDFINAVHQSAPGLGGFDMGGMTYGATASLQQPIPPPPPYSSAIDPVPPAIGFIVGPRISGEPSGISSSVVVPPPPYSEFVTLNIDCPHSEEQIREAILEFYKDDCCFDPKSLDILQIRDIIQTHAFRYLLDTFLETRTVQENSEPYKNQLIDGAQNGPVPDKWDVAVINPPQFIHKAKFAIDVPHSASIMPCNKCHSTGFTACNSCNGMGFSRCNWCNGSGRRSMAGSTSEYESCSSCCGMGRNNCSWCELGRIRCRTCNGHRFLKVWKCLTIKWRTERKVHETERGELKPKHLKKARCNETLASSETMPSNPQPLKCLMDPNIFLVA